MTDASQIEQFFGSSMEQYEGLDQAVASIASTQRLSDSVIACEIDWEHRKKGKAVGEEHGHYVLKRDGNRLKIHVYTPRTA